MNKTENKRDSLGKIHYSHGTRWPITDPEQWAADDRLLEYIFGPMSPEEIKSRDEARAEYLRKAAEPPEEIFNWEEIERLSNIAHARGLHTFDELLNLLLEEGQAIERTAVPPTPLRSPATHAHSELQTSEAGGHSLHAGKMGRDQHWHQDGIWVPLFSCHPIR